MHIVGPLPNLPDSVLIPHHTILPAIPCHTSARMLDMLAQRGGQVKVRLASHAPHTKVLYLFLPPFFPPSFPPYLSRALFITLAL